MKRGTVMVVVVLGILFAATSFWMFNPFDDPGATAPTSGEQPTDIEPAQGVSEGATEAGSTPETTDAGDLKETTDAVAVASALVAFTANPLSGIATGADESFDSSTALPPGSTLVPEPDSWAPDGFDGGTMNVELLIDGNVDSRYIAIMVQEDSGWKLLGTIEQTLTDIP